MVDFKFIDAEELTSDLFKDIVIYAIAEPGAMGIPCLMDFVPKDGHCFSVFYVVIKKEYFPIFDKINNDDYMDWELKSNLEKFINAINSEK